MLMFLLVCICGILIYRYTTRNHEYWVKKNVKHDRPLPFFGNHLPNFLVRRTTSDIGIELYNKYKNEKVVGYYRGSTPELIIRDPEIVAHILSVDFKSFPDRIEEEYVKNDPLLQNIVFLCGEKWRAARQQLTPGMSPNKLRGMFPLLLECVEKLDQTVEGIAAWKEDAKAYDLMMGYTLACISYCGFGMGLNTISAERSNFVEQAKRFFNQSKQKMRILALAELLPEVTKFFSPKIVSKDLESITVEMTRTIRKHRNWKPSGRNDFMDILLEIEAQRNPAYDDKSGNDLEKNCKQEESKEALLYASAQLFLLLIGGFETTATAMSTTLHQLAHHPDIQMRVQEQIDQILFKYDNKYTFECLNDLALLEMALKESIRILSPFGFFRRIAAERYTLPGTDVTIDRGVRILIPTQALHMDPEYFENPEEFRPERFSAEAQNISYKYMAFGEGPRKCIGTRLALMIAIAGLAGVLRRFTVVPAKASKYTLSVKKTSYLVQIVEGGIPLRFIPRA